MTIDWLFERKPEGWSPQRGWARSDKVVRLWVPGNKTLGSSEYLARVIQDCALSGATQLAFKFPVTRLQHEQNAAVVWIGLDIDDEPDQNKITTAMGNLPYSLRLSNSGRGLHLFLRLAYSIHSDYKMAREIVKRLGQPIRERLEAAGQAVCKSDCRIFCLEGGKQAWIKQEPGFYEPPDLPCGYTAHGGGVVTRPVQTFVGESVEPLALGYGVGRHQIHIGTLVKRLRELGETIETKSRMSGLNTDVNGFFEIGPNYIWLFSNADNKIIWRWIAP